MLEENENVMDLNNIITAAVKRIDTNTTDCQFLGKAISRTATSRARVSRKGTRYKVCESNDGHITSGCIRKPVEWWLENVERCAEENGYTTEQQIEYREIFEFVAARMKDLGTWIPVDTTE